MSDLLGPPSGHVFRVDRVRGPVWYAKYRLPDGRQVQKKLGPAWTGRGRPSRATSQSGLAEDWLRSTLEQARRGTLPGAVWTGATFADAAAEFLRYCTQDRMTAGCQALRARPATALRVTAAPAIRWVVARSGTGPDRAGMVTLMCRCSQRWCSGSYGVWLRQHCHTTRHQARPTVRIARDFRLQAPASGPAPSTVHQPRPFVSQRPS